MVVKVIRVIEDLKTSVDRILRQSVLNSQKRAENLLERRKITFLWTENEIINLHNANFSLSETLDRSLFHTM